MEISTIGMQLLKTIKELPSHLKKRFFISIIILIIGIMCSISHPLLLRMIINKMNINATNEPFLIWLILLASYGLSWTCSQVSNILVWFLFQQPTDRIAGIVFKKTFSHLLDFPFSFYMKYDYRKIASIEKIFQIIPTIFSNIIIYVLPSCIEMILSLIVFTWLYGLAYGSLLSILLGGLIACTIFIAFKADDPDRNYRKKLGILTHRISEVTTNFEMVKIFTNEQFEINYIDKLLNNFEEASRKRAFYLDGIQGVQTILCGIVMVLFSCISGYGVYIGKIQTGDFVLINTYLIQFATPLTWLGYTFAEIYRGLSGLFGAFEIQEITEKEDKNLSHIDFSNTTIIFKNITFYQNELKILNKISFTIPEKKTVGLVGFSGSGKSTCVRLLLKLLETNEGEIKIGEHSIKDLDSYSLRQQISVVSQEPILFSGTLRENIMYGNHSATQSDLFDAITASSLDTLLEKLPDGIDTDISTIQLSGGEKQRIAIARAFIKKPKIFIFDEPTAALDSKTEREIQESIYKITAKYTSIIITHRLALVKNADSIIVLKNGRVGEEGTHEDLIKKEGLYYHFWHEQNEVESE
jgi:ABC-type multidrug transport system fused ATPase/permease subunit